MKKLYRMTVISDRGVVTHHIQPKAFSLEQLQKAVGGYIETIGFFTTFEGKRCKAYADEEGKVHAKAFNRIATYLWQEQFQNATTLVGDVAILTRVAPGEGH